MMMAAASGWFRLSIVVSDRRRVAAERRHPNCHEREEREIGNNIVQFLGVGDIENAEIGIAPCNSPQMTPSACILQFLRAMTFRLFQLVSAFGRQRRGQMHIHFDLKQHDNELLIVMTDGRSGARYGSDFNEWTKPHARMEARRSRRLIATAPTLYLEREPIVEISPAPGRD